MATKEELDAAFQTAYQKAEEEQMRLHREEVERRKAHMARKRPATELEKSEGSPMKEASRSTEPLSLSHKKAIDVPNSPTSPTPSYRSLSDSKTKQPSFASTLIAAQKRSVKKSPTPTNSASNNPADSASTSSRMPPSWYVEMKTKSGQRKPETGRRELLERVKQICRHIQDCQGNSAEAFNEMRLYLHTMAFQGGINESILKDAKMLDNDRGLPQIMDNDIFPSDIKADAEELYNKWSLKDFNIDLLRNIKRGSKSSHIEDKDAKKPANIFGDNDLMCGQWWPTQLCTLRDGAHGSAQGGIYGNPKDGAYSIVMSHGYKDDVDSGEEIWYCGTDRDLPAGEPTGNTQAMMTSEKTKKSVRVLRSYNMRKASTYRPRCGFRYDGLYKVVNSKELDAEKQIYRFHLLCLPEQIPIRFQGPEARPTDQEEREFQKFKNLQRSSG